MRTGNDITINITMNKQNERNKCKKLEMSVVLEHELEIPGKHVHDKA